MKEWPRENIIPGEQYSGDVRVYDKPKRLIVFKYHIFPYCDEPEDPDEDKIFDSDESDLESIALDNKAA